MPVSNNPAVQNTATWLFGSEQWRYETDGTVRAATALEITLSDSTKPGAILAALNTGADALRFEAAGFYQADFQDIAALYKQTNKDAKTIAAEVEAATAAVRNKMRRDIAHGHFYVNPSGQVMQRVQQTDTQGNLITQQVNGETRPVFTDEEKPLEREQVGFELNALLIESMNEKVSRLNQLNSQLALLDQWYQSASDGGSKEALLFYHQKTERERQSKKSTLGIHENWSSGWLTTTQNRRNQINSSFSGFISSNVPGAGNARNYFNSTRAELEDLLLGSGLQLSAWTQGASNKVTNTTSWSERKTNDGLFVDYYERERYITTQTGRTVVARGAFTQSMETVRTQVRSLTSLSEQLGTDFRTNNSRFNGVLEAMNNFNKQVTDSMSRLAVSGV